MKPILSYNQRKENLVLCDYPRTGTVVVLLFSFFLFFFYWLLLSENLCPTRRPCYDQSTGETVLPPVSNLSLFQSKADNSSSLLCCTFLHWKSAPEIWLIFNRVGRLRTQQFLSPCALHYHRVNVTVAYLSHVHVSLTPTDGDCCDLEVLKVAIRIMLKPWIQWLDSICWTVCNLNKVLP